MSVDNGITLHHVALTVSNIKRSTAWYHDTLGFKLWHEHKTDAIHFAELELNGFNLELFSFGPETKALPSYRRELRDDLHTIGTKHLALGVDDLDQAITWLKSKGVNLATEVDTASFGGRFVFFKDPNGILIELIETQ